MLRSMLEYRRSLFMAVCVALLLWIAASSCSDSRWEEPATPAVRAPIVSDAPLPVVTVPPGPPANAEDVVATMAAVRREHEHADYYALQGTASNSTPPKHPRPWNAPVETPLARAIRETGSIKNAVGKRNLQSEYFANRECRWVFTGYNESPFEKAWEKANRKELLQKELTAGYKKFRSQFDRLISDMDTHGAAWYTRHQLPTSAATNTFAGTTTSISEQTAAAFRQETAPEHFSKNLPAGGAFKIPSAASGSGAAPAPPAAAAAVPVPTVDKMHPLCQDEPLSGPDPVLYPTMSYRLQCPREFPFAMIHPDVARKFRPGSEVDVPIEPIVGLLRSPKGMPGKHAMWSHIPSRDYMMVDSWTLRRNLPLTVRAAQPRVIFMDMGARGWQTSIIGGTAGHNQAWFEWTYRERCINFDLHVGIEKEKYDQHTFWSDKKKGVPGWMQSRYQWVNRGAETDPASWGNPWNFVLSETTPDDIVLIKLDIDTPAVEGPLVEQLLQMPEVMKRIDEFYFEYHVTVEGMSEAWRTQQEATNIDALECFKKLRANGVRSHSWI